MTRRKSAALCALPVWFCAAAFSQAIPILPAPDSIPKLAATVAVDNAKKSTSVPPAVTVDGRSFDWAIVAEAADTTHAYRHLSAHVLHVPESYARFALAGDRILGTVVTPDATYRLLPAGSGQVSVHRLAEGNDRDARFRLITDPANAADRALERRHVQLERLALLQPKRAFGYAHTRSFKLEGGSLGKLPDPPTTQAIAAVIDGIAAAIDAPDPLELQAGPVMKFSNVTSLPRGALVNFSQTIRGIPVLGTNQLVIDGEGTIVELVTQFLEPARASNRPVISEPQARSAAIRRIEFETGTSGVQYELAQPVTLQYQVDGYGPGWAPYYTFTLRAQRQNAVIGVTVHGNSGKAIVIVNPQLL